MLTIGSMTSKTQVFILSEKIWIIFVILVPIEIVSHYQILIAAIVLDKMSEGL